MLPIDFTSELQKFLPTTAFAQRIAALSGFRLNLTADGPMVGAAGELIAEDYFRQQKSNGHISSFKYTGNQPGHDIEVLLGGKLFTIDVKTKRRSFEPAEYFEMSVPAYLYNNPQYRDPDFFLCVQVNCDKANRNILTRGWVVGYISKENYLLKRTLVAQGSQVGGSQGTQGVMPTDVYNVEFRHLEHP